MTTTVVRDVQETVAIFNMFDIGETLIVTATGAMINPNFGAVVGFALRQDDTGLLGSNGRRLLPVDGRHVRPGPVHAEPRPDPVPRRALGAGAAVFRLVVPARHGKRVIAPHAARGERVARGHRATRGR